MDCGTREKVVVHVVAGEVVDLEVDRLDGVDEVV